MIDLVNIEEVEKPGKKKFKTQPKKYTREILIQRMQQFVKENGRSPKAEDFKNNPNYPSYTPYMKEFGTWNKALEASGLEVNLVQDYYNKEILIEKMLQWAREHDGIPPRQEDFEHNPKYPSTKPYVNEFGNWNNAKIAAGFEPYDEATKSRLGEVQTISEFKTEGAIDLSGENRKSPCDGICPKGELFDTKSSSPTKKHGFWGWNFTVTLSQLEEVEYLFLRAYDTSDFTKPPKYKWRVPIEFMEGKTTKFIHKDENMGIYNVKSMRRYEIQDEI